jgi:hypothetical protein
MIKRQRLKNSNIFTEIIYKDKINTTPESIANGFADYLHELYQPSTKSSFDDRTLHEINEAYTKIKQTCKEETMLYLEDRSQKMMLLLNTTYTKQTGL